MRRVKLAPENEMFVWVVSTCVAITAFLFSHTGYVTAFTYWCGIPLIGLTAFLFWMRFRPRGAQSKEVPRRVSNSMLVVLSLIVLLYVLGIATWYE